jgi:hypothetical protein
MSRRQPILPAECPHPRKELLSNFDRVRERFFHGPIERRVNAARHLDTDLKPIYQRAEELARPGVQIAPQGGIDCSATRRRLWLVKIVRSRQGDRHPPVVTV